jgi:hypothetical protein
MTFNCRGTASLTKLFQFTGEFCSVKPAYNGTARDQTFSFAGKFCSIQVLEFLILGTSKVPLKTVLLYALVPLKAGSILTVIKIAVEHNLSFIAPITGCRD